MTRVLSELVTLHLDNDRFVQLTRPFIFISDELAKAGLKSRVTVPKDFVQDFESVPITRGRNKRGGTVHDYLSCIDSDPVVTKALAAAVYLEMNAYTDSIDYGRNKYLMVRDFFRRWSKWAVVYVWPGYFHQRKVLASCEEIAGIKCDPYITVEKLEAAIVQSEQATATIKAVPEQVEQKAELVEASEQVTDDLKEAKTDALSKI